jgi:FkbM family methyltransferase
MLKNSELPAVSSRGMWLIQWLHAHGAQRANRRGLGRVAANLSWASWMTLWFARQASRNRMRAVGRLWRWQLSRRVIKRPILIELPLGGHLLCPPWSSLGGELAAVGFHAAPETTMFISDVLRPGDLMLDVGANIGVYSITGASRGATVIAFEPTKRAAAILLKSARINGWGSRIRVHETALTDFDGAAGFTVGLDVGDHLIGDFSPGQTVEARRLDTFLAEHVLLQSVTLLKIDVEGSDLDVLKGAKATIERDRPCMIVEVWDGGVDIRRFLLDLDYRVYRYCASRRALQEVAADFAGQSDFVAVHDSRLAGIRATLESTQRRETMLPRIQWRTFE